MTSSSGPIPNASAYSQILYRSIERAASADYALPAGGANCNADYHLFPIEYPIRVTGFSLAASTGATSGTLMRLWVQAADPSNNYLPYGTPLIDTGAAGFTVGDAQFSTTGLTNADKYREVTLSSTVDIIQPGVYWVGVLAQSPASGGTFRGTTTRGHLRGLRDLTYTAATPTNANFATFSIPTSVVGNIQCSSDNRGGNLQIGLMCQRLG